LALDEFILQLPVKCHVHLSLMRLMRPMRFSISAVLALATLAACNPTFNWRDVRPDGTALSLLMPCKPDKAQKTVPLGGQPTELMLLSCDAGGVTFAVAVADVKDAAKTAATLAQWQSATLANIKATPLTPGAALKLTGLPSGAVLVKATGQRANGQAVSSRAAYFAQGAQVFQAVMYADKIAPDVADTFFSGLKFE
jgi:hypothetical protein